LATKVVAAPARRRRRDDEARPGGEVVEPAEDGVVIDDEAHFLGKLAQRRCFGRLTRVDAAARQRPLAGVIAQRCRAARQQQRGAVARRLRRRQAVEIGARAFVDHRHRHRSALRRDAGMGMDIERRQPLAQQRLESRVAPDRRHGAGPLTGLVVTKRSPFVSLSRPRWLQWQPYGPAIVDGDRS